MSLTKTEQNTPIIAVATDKGGVGKTTVAISLAAGLAGLAELGEPRDVLLVDADPQCNASQCLLPGPPKTRLYHSLMDETIPLVRYNVMPHLDIVPASTKMFGLGYSLIQRYLEARLRGISYPDPRGILARLISQVASEYDYVIIDSPPSDGLLALNVLFAANHILIPMVPEPFSYQGVINYVNILNQLNQTAGTAIKVNGILVNNFETGSAGHAKAEAALRNWAGDLVYGTRIRHSRPLYNAVLACKDIFSYDPASIGAKDFRNFICELTTRLNSNG